MSALLIKEFENLPDLAKDRAARFVKFGYMLAMTDILRLHKTEETMNITLDRYKYGTSIDAEELHKILINLSLHDEVNKKIKEHEAKGI
jgi:hypothetical protein